MALSINQNIQAFNAYRNLSVTQGDLSKSLEKLSSGYRINRAADDAAGLAISEGLRGQVGGLKQASRNAQDGISVVQTAEGALTEVHSMLQRIRTLAVQGANDSNNNEARLAINQEIGQLADELDRVGKSTSFNGTNLLQKNSSGAVATLTFQVGANATAGQIGVKTVNIAATDAAGTAVTDSVAAKIKELVAPPTNQTGGAATTGSLYGAYVDVDPGAGTDYREQAVTGDKYAAAITTIDDQIKSVSKSRSELGAVQNRFEHTINNLNVAVENLSASESRIRDTDMASEMTMFTRSQILSQAGTAMLAQANQIPQGVLSLLR